MIDLDQGLARSPDPRWFRTSAPPFERRTDPLRFAVEGIRHEPPCHAHALRGRPPARRPAGAAEFEVKMLNKSADGQLMVFEPALLRVQPGDTAHFVPTDKSHDAETIPGMLPDGAQPF